MNRLLTTVICSAAALAAYTGLTSGCSIEGQSATTTVQATTQTSAPTDVTATPAEGGRDVVETLGPSQTLTLRDKPVIIDFSASWCGPCRVFAPVYHEVAARNTDNAYFMTIDIDSFPDIARQFRVMAVPQVAALMPDGNIVFARGGALSGRDLTLFVNRVTGNH